MLDKMYIISHSSEFVDLRYGQASADQDGTVGVYSLGLSDDLSALGRGCGSYTAGVDNNQIRPLGKRQLRQSQLLKMFPDLLAFILIDLASKGTYSKRLHNMVSS